MVGSRSPRGAPVGTGTRGCQSLKPLRGRKPAQIRLPAVRNLRRRQADEEHGRGRSRRPAQLHRHLVRQPVPFAQVARRTRRDDVLPDRLAAAALRYDVVEREPPAGAAALDATPIVTGEERPARDLPLHRPGYANVLDEPDYVRPGKRRRRRPQRLVELLDHLGLALEYEHMRAPNRRHIERLVARIQHQYLLQDSQKGSSGTAVDYLDIALSTASSSSGERAIEERPCSSSFT